MCPLLAVGTLPDTFGSLTKLTFLQLSIGSLTGSYRFARVLLISCVCWTYRNARCVNAFSIGPIPSSLGSLSNVANILLSSNLLEGLCALSLQLLQSVGL